MNIEHENNRGEMGSEMPEAPKIPEKISEVERIKKSATKGAVGTKEALKELVELPLLTVCEELYDKNIRTIQSSANKKDVKVQHGYITIDFESLSDENKEIAQQLGTVDENWVTIEIPLTENSTFEEVKSYAGSIAHQFKKQPMTWAQTFTLEQLRKAAGSDPDDESISVESLANDFYYDPKRKLFYSSEEHFRKANESAE